jgi:predicted DCC family thiol-disulfide oxidoreductase YuxK
MRAQVATRSTLVFDGDCAFCSSSVRWLTAHLAEMPPATPWQWANLESLGLTEQLARERVWFVTDSGQYGGHLALAQLLKQQRQAGWRLVGWLLRTPPFSFVARLGYFLVARYRYRLPGGTPACKMPR